MYASIVEMFNLVPSLGTKKVLFNQTSFVLINVLLSKESSMKCKKINSHYWFDTITFFFSLNESSINDGQENTRILVPTADKYFSLKTNLYFGHPVRAIFS